MKISKRFAAFFAVLGTALLIFSVCFCFSGLNAQPVLLKTPEDAAARGIQMLDAVCAGDYNAAGKYMLGHPNLGSGAQVDSEMGRLIWDAFVDSFRYELVGDIYISEGGISQDVWLSCLDMQSVTKNLKEYAQTILPQRVAEEEDPSVVYTDENEYQESFVMDVLREATLEALEKDARYQEQTLTLHFRYEQGQWWIQPEQALIGLLSGNLNG